MHNPLFHHYNEERELRLEPEDAAEKKVSVTGILSICLGLVAAVVLGLGLVWRIR